MIFRLTISALFLSILTTWAAPRLTTPINESTLSGSTVEFEWTPDTSEVFFWHLAVGSEQGADDLFSRGYSAEARSQTVSGLPVDGSGVFVRLYYMVRTDTGFRFLHTDYTFSTPLPAPPALTTPAPGSVFQSEDVIFRWEDRGTLASTWRLQVGSTVGGAEYADTSLGADVRSVEITGLPADGSPVWVRFHYFFGNIWRHIDYQFTAKITSTTPVITSPAPGGTVTSLPFVVQWTPSLTTVTKWQVQVGAAQGGSEILDTGELAAETRAATVDTLPDGTTTFWIRLRYEADGNWEEKDFEVAYDPNGDGAPQVFNPPPGTEIVGAQAQFQWTGNSVAVEQWWIYVGTSTGDDSLFNRDMGTATAVTVNNLPTDGAPLYVRLFYRVGEIWNQRDHLYTSRRLPKMVFPAPGTQITGPQIKFEWDDNGVIGNAWGINVGRTRGGTDIFESGTLLGDQRTRDVIIPPSVTGEVWVRLLHLPDSLQWGYADFLYTVQSPQQPALLEPAPGSTINGGGEQRLHFGPNGTTLFAYWVYVGTSVGARDLFNSGFINSEQTSVDVTFANEDATIHVRLWWLVGINRWSFADYTLRVAKNENPGGPAPAGPITPPGT